MNKHKHYDMIVAKAENMDLVIFIFDYGKWQEYKSTGFPSFDCESYFACIPQHKEACSHWLSGGNVEGNYDGNWVDIVHHEWSGQSHFMREEDYIIRIKPRKEKRWIGRYNHNITRQHFESAEIARDFIKRDPEYKHCDPVAWQFIEIEVEV